MEKILDIITTKMQKAFEEAGYDASFGRVTVRGTIHNLRNFNHH